MRKDDPLDSLLQIWNYKIQSYKRPKVKANRQPEGGCAIIYNENRFKASKTDVYVCVYVCLCVCVYVYVPKGVEASWLILKPPQKSDLIENIAIG